MFSSIFRCSGWLGAASARRRDRFDATALLITIRIGIFDRYHLRTSQCESLSLSIRNIPPALRRQPCPCPARDISARNVESPCSQPHFSGISRRNPESDRPAKRLCLDVLMTGKMPSARADCGCDLPLPGKKLFVPTKRIYPHSAKTLNLLRFGKQALAAPFLLRAPAGDKEATGATMGSLVRAVCTPSRARAKGGLEIGR